MHSRLTPENKKIYQIPKNEFRNTVYFSKLKCKLLADIVSRQGGSCGRQSSRPVSRRLYKLTIGILFYGRYPMPFFESHNRYAHRILGRFDGYCAGIEKKNSAGGGLQNILTTGNFSQYALISFLRFVLVS